MGIFEKSQEKTEKFLNKTSDFVSSNLQKAFNWLKIK